MHCWGQYRIDFRKILETFGSPHPTFVELPSKSVFEGVTLILIADTSYASYAEFDAVVPAPYSFCQTDETVLHLGVSLSLASSVL